MQLLLKSCASFITVHFSASWLRHGNLRWQWQCGIMRIQAATKYYLERHLTLSLSSAAIA